ncbi:MAG: hypothetical protein AAB916_00715 [Patescibacteria group bacterium]
MDFAKIQKFVIGRGEKFVILQDGEPAMVVMSFSDYERMATSPRGKGGSSTALHPASEETITLPQRQDEWQMADAPETEFIADEQPAPGTGMAPRPRLDEIRLEDLPL